jgi:hypothetical protein
MRLYSATCTTQVIVVRAPSDPLEITCGGVSMATSPDADAPAPLDPAYADGTLLGKRYTDGGGLELLATKGGGGSLALGSALLVVLEPKRLPSSD